MAYRCTLRSQRHTDRYRDEASGGSSRHPLGSSLRDHRYPQNSRDAAPDALAMSVRLRSAIPRGAERIHCRFSIGSVAVLTSVASLPLVKVYAPEPRDFARNGLVDAPDMPSFKEDDVAFRDSIGIAL